VRDGDEEMGGEPMDDPEDLQRRLRALEAIVGLILTGQVERPSIESAIALGEDLKSLSRARGDDLPSLLTRLREKLPYFNEQAYLRRNVVDARNRVTELEEALARLSSLETFGIDPRTVAERRFVPVRIWLETDNDEHAIRVSSAVERINDAIGLQSTYGFSAEHGSRFFRWWSRTKDALTSEEVTERLQKAERAIELAALHRVQADVDQKQAAAAAQLIESLKPVPNGVCTIGSVLVVKITDASGHSKVIARTLTQKEMIAIERDDHIMRDAHALLKRLDAINAEGPTPAIQAAPSDDVIN
jgi:hypothetical protein